MSFFSIASCGSSRIGPRRPAIFLRIFNLTPESIKRALRYRVGKQPSLPVVDGAPVGGDYKLVFKQALARSTQNECSITWSRKALYYYGAQARNYQEVEKHAA